MENDPQQLLIKCIQQSCELDKDDPALFLKYFHPQTFKRKESILNSGSVAHHLYFVISGVLHHFFCDQSGQQYTCNFGLPHTFITDLESFANQRPSTHNIESLQQTQCLCISCVNCVTLMSKSKAFQTYIYQMLEQIALDNLRRTTDLIALSPEMRYQRLITTQNYLQQLIPQKYLASYLGISPESLSRLKRRQTLKAKS